MEYWISIILAVILAGLFIILYLPKNEDYFKKHGIPYETPLPLFGNMIQPVLRITSHIEKMRKIYYMNTEAKYVGFYDFSCPLILIRDPELAKNIRVKYFDHFVDHRAVTDPVTDPLFGKNLFSLHGDNWREMRNLLSPAFTSSKMKSMFKLMTECSENFTNYMVEQVQKQKTFTINSKDAFARYTNDVIATCAFGIAVDSMRNPHNEFYTLGRKATDFEGLLSLKFFLMHNFPSLAKLLRIKLMDDSVERFFYDLVRDTVRIRDEKGISRPDMIQLMMESRKNTDHGPKLTTQDMTSQAFIFFFGGFDTVATFLCFLAHEISIDSEVQARLHNEIDEVHEKYNGHPTYETINSMPFLDAVINETTRLHAIGAFMDRICTKSFELPPTLPGAKPLNLKPGDNVIIPWDAFQTDPQYYPHPYKFSPDRFMDDPKRILNSPTFTPFGTGPRMCIGNRFALLESKIMIYHLMVKCILKPSKKMILPLKLSTSSIIATAKGGFWLDLQLRNENK